MRRDMFGDIVDPSITVGTKRWYTVPLSVLTHAVVIGAVVLVPVLASDVLPTPQSVLAFVAVPPPPAPPPAPAPPPPPTAQPAMLVNPAAAPLEAPTAIVLDPPPPPQPSYSLADAVRGVKGGIPGGPPGGTVTIASPSSGLPTEPIRPGGDIRAPTKIKDVAPVYPPLALTAQVEGMVIIEAILTKDGTVRDPKVLRSVALLDRAALEAVRQWRYTPTTLNGVPVEVIITVTVHFSIR